jgi:tripartite motif-containing protein 71
VGLLEECGVTFDASGNLWVADSGANMVEEFGLSGNLITSWSVPSDGSGVDDDPGGIAVDPNGHVFLTSPQSSRNDVEEYTRTGTFIATIASSGSGNGQVENPIGVAVDETNGDLYVVDDGNTRIQRWVLVM